MHDSAVAEIKAFPSKKAKERKLCGDIWEKSDLAEGAVVIGDVTNLN